MMFDLRNTLWLPLCLMPLLFTGCPAAPGTGAGGSAPPAFSLAWSEYPSWSVFGVAHAKGLVHKDEGKLGPIEEKWGVDIVLKQADYDPCITMYGSGSVDAVCITNMDILAPSLSRDSVAILPTSTSDGADACIVTGIDTVDDLAGINSYGLEKSVSQYTFERNLEILGKSAADFPFKNMDPGAAAQALMNQQGDIQSIVVWNPFVMQTLRTRSDSKVLFDSKSIPEEIIDMVVVSKQSLNRDKGGAFACAVIEAFYEVNKLLADAEQGDSTLVALGEKFSNLELEDMKQVVQQTKFYKAPADAIGLFSRADFQETIMPRVVDFCTSHEMVESAPKIGYGNPDAQLDFSTDYIKKVQSGP